MPHDATLHRPRPADASPSVKTRDTAAVRDALWTSYRETGDVTARNRLFESYYGVVVTVVNGMQRVGHRDDLLSHGALGLLDAIARYNPENGTFGPYALARVRGAVIDEVRRASWVPKRVHQRVAAVARMQSMLEGRLGRSPTDDEVADQMALSVAAIRRTMVDAVAIHPLSTEIFEPSRTPDPLVRELRPVGPRPEGAYELTAVLDRLAGAIDGLPERSRAVLGLIYKEELTLKQAGAELGVGTTSACNFRASALMELRVALGASARVASERPGAPGRAAAPSPRTNVRKGR